MKYNISIVKVDKQEIQKMISDFNKLCQRKGVIINEIVLVNLLTVISYTLYSRTIEAIFDFNGRLLGEKIIKDSH
jgi:hypothetical protein